MSAITADAAATPARISRGAALRGKKAAGLAAKRHKDRCKAHAAIHGMPTAGEMAAMVAAFHAKGGTVTVGEPVYLLPVNNGAGGYDARA